MAFIKKESENIRIEEAFRVKHEDTEEQTDMMALKEENGVLNAINEEDQYMNHHDFKTEEKSFSCSQTEATSIQEGAPKTGNVSCFTCQECGKSLTHKASLFRHMRIHTGERPFTCNLCGKSFNRKETLDSHMRVHTYTCPQCGKSFSQKGKYEDHIRIHIDEKPYKCPQCGKGFIRKEHFEEHIRTHTGEKPFTCQQCGNSFRQERNLNRHMITHIGEKSFVCSQCGMSFKKEAAHKHHMKIHMKNCFISDVSKTGNT